MVLCRRFMMFILDSMELFLKVFGFILGTIIGSFLNVVIYRLNTGMGVKGRSFCDACGKTLHWYELVPLFSFVWQRGQCMKCGVKLSWQYPVVECGTGLLFLLVISLGLPVLPSISLMILSAVLMVVTVYDIKHFIIPNQMVLWFVGLSLVGVVLGVFGVNAEFFLEERWWSHLLAGVLIPLPFFLIWYLSKGKMLGLGDVKLMVPVGLYLGLSLGFSAVIISFWVGALYAILLLYRSFMLWIKQKYTGCKIRKKAKVWGREVPFGPFLAIGILVVAMFRLDIFSIVHLFI